jgi:hypothetical protein
LSLPFGTQVEPGVLEKTVFYVRPKISKLAILCFRNDLVLLQDFQRSLHRLLSLRLYVVLLSPLQTGVNTIKLASFVWLCANLVNNISRIMYVLQNAISNIHLSMKLYGPLGIMNKINELRTMIHKGNPNHYLTGW